MEYIKYAQAFNASPDVIYWLKHTLKKHLEKQEATQVEIEHIIDYLVSEDAPKRLNQMSYEQAVKKADTWTKKLQKEAEKITETDEDTELVHDFGDGFRIVKLIGENAYKREGYIMRHCVASYYGSGKEIYSLRDINNKPHCTLEKDRQIKGKGNGSIHPKYVNYIIKFLELSGMTVGDSEMKHLGYINIEKFKDKLHKDTKYINGVYVREDEELLGVNGKYFADMGLWEVKTLLKEKNDSLVINYDLNRFIDNLELDIIKCDYSQLASSEDDSKLASSGSYSKLASSGSYSKLASSGSYSKLASSGYVSKLASSGDDSQLVSSGSYSKLASSGYVSKLASSGSYSKLASSGSYSKLASSGSHSRLASSGDDSQLVSSGSYSQLASSGDYSELDIKGEKSVGANIGYRGKIRGVLGSWITLAEYDDKRKVSFVRSAQIDGKELKADTWYKLDNKKFVEVK